MRLGLIQFADIYIAIIDLLYFITTGGVCLLMNAERRIL